MASAAFPLPSRTIQDTYRVLLENGDPELGANGNGTGARPLVFWVAHAVVLLVPCCQTFGGALVPNEITSHPFLLNAS
ncbi:hypothetical protein AMTR_s00008p00207250 [Amborella trichopoda]|uniref:Uncharacterized protein n=1 Tax=Amborella trichopoda TaxID=13333 RepID=W1NIT7_AMBTC|nr:hypothetical protein AMTR_s00008p00207250 [Amborella trichopoda]